MKSKTIIQLCIVSWLTALIVGSCGCAATNKQHYRKTHHCDYSGANPIIKGADQARMAGKTIVKKPTVANR